MKSVRIAELKSRLSEYLRAVRNGETIAVLDRDTLVAQIVPVRERVALRIRKPAAGTPPPNRVKLPKPLKLDIDNRRFAARGAPEPDYPRPINGIFVAITVMNWTFTSSGNPAM